MSLNKLINNLKSSNLFAECTHCGEEFKLSDAVLFDGCGIFPEDADKKRNEMLEELEQHTDELKKRKFTKNKTSFLLETTKK